MKFFPRRAGLAIVLLLLVISASFISSHFLNPINILNVLRQVALYGILGVGMTFVILTKGIDLSVGSTVSSLPFFPQGRPFLKCRLYLFPSRQTVTSMYSEAYCVAQEPRPLVPNEKS